MKENKKPCDSCFGEQDEQYCVKCSGTGQIPVNIKYTLTLKGSVPKILFDGPLGRFYSGCSGEYIKMEVEAKNEEDMIKELKLITNGTDLKLIGVNY